MYAKPFSLLLTKNPSPCGESVAREAKPQGEGLSFLLAFLLLCWTAFAHAGPKIQTWDAPNGSKVYFVPTEGLPMVDVRVVFDAGSARDGAKYGLATLTAGLLDTGAGTWNADAIAKRLEGVGAQLGAGASRDSAFVSLRSLTDPALLEPALQTMKAILTQPSFNAEDFEREKKNLLLGLKQREESPADLAGLTFFQTLYGDHPYAHPKEGNLDTVEKLTRDDLQAFYKQHYVANNALIVIVGEVDKTQADSIVATLLSGLPSGAAAPALPAVPPLAAANTVRKFFPSAQTHVYSGLPGIAVNDPDFFPLYVGNHILGGSGLVSKIFEEVREKRGLSYGASSYFYPYRVPGPFLMGLQSKNDTADEAVNVLHQTLRDFIQHGPSAKEMQAAKQNITGGFAMRMDSNKKLIDQVAHIAYYGLPLDYLDTFISKVEAVSAQDVQRAFKARIDADKLLTIMVGAGAKP